MCAMNRGRRHVDADVEHANSPSPPTSRAMRQAKSMTAVTDGRASTRRGRSPRTAALVRLAQPRPSVERIGARDLVGVDRRQQPAAPVALLTNGHPLRLKTRAAGRLVLDADPDGTRPQLNCRTATGRCRRLCRTRCARRCPVGQSGHRAGGRPLVVVGDDVIDQAADRGPVLRKVQTAPADQFTDLAACSRLSTAATSHG
jgi:hypothetical protein